MTSGRLTPSRAALLALLLLLAACGAGGSGAADRERGPGDDRRAGLAPSGDDPEGLAFPDGFRRLEGVVDLGSLGGPADTFAEWQGHVPAIEDVDLPPAADGEVQGALWLAPQGDAPQPLLVVLHSWSTRYLQGFSIPYARWADQEGWAMIAPDFRGVFERPEATGSDLAVADVLDAVDWAVERGGVDPERVFVVGFSGGGMMSLLMAGRHAEVFAAAVSWVPVHDLVDWYAYNRDEQPGETYERQIAASCGGDPTSDPGAREECEQRSPQAHLDAARDAGLPVFLGHGLSDRTVPADHAVRAFDHLAAEADRLGERVREAAAGGELADDVPGRQAEDFFGEQDPEVLLARRSGAATLVLFEGEHDMVFHPGLAFLSAVSQQVVGARGD